MAILIGLSIAVIIVVLFLEEQLKRENQEWLDYWDKRIYGEKGKDDGEFK